MRSYEGIAEKALNALQQQAPDSPLLELVVADVAVSQEKYPAALAIYRRVMEGAPPVGGLHEAVAEIYERAGKPEWAAQERRADQAALRRPSAPARRGVRLSRRQVSRVARGRPAVADVRAGRYWTIRAANRLATEAVARLESLPPSVELHLIRAELAQSGGRNTEAVAEVRAALKLSPGNPVIERALAEALLQAHDTDEALPLLERLNRERPDDALLFMYGDALLQSQQIERAIPILERAAGAKDAPVAAHAALGRAYVQVGRYEEALPHLIVASKGDQDGDVHLQLARALQALGRAADAQKAMAEYQRLRQQAAPSGTAEKALTPPK